MNRHRMVSAAIGVAAAAAIMISGCSSSTSSNSGGSTPSSGASSSGGGANTATGGLALQENSTGNQNVADGSTALISNSTGASTSVDASITQSSYTAGNRGHGNSIFGVLTNQQSAPKGIKDSDAYSHFSFVRTLQDMFGLADPDFDDMLQTFAENFGGGIRDHVYIWKRGQRDDDDRHAREAQQKRAEAGCHWPTRR